MSKFTAFVIIVALRLVFHPSNAQTVIAPFASATHESTRQAPPLPESTISTETSKSIRPTRSILEYILIRKWLLGENDDHPFYGETEDKKLYHVSSQSINKATEYSFIFEIKTDI